MKEKLNTQVYLFLVFLAIIGIIAPSIPGISYIHEAGHYFYAKAIGCEAYIQDSHHTVIKTNSKLPAALYLAGPFTSIFVFWLLSFASIIIIPLKCFSVAGVFTGLFIGIYFHELFPGDSIGSDFIMVAKLFNLDLHKTLLHTGLILMSLIVAVAVIRFFIFQEIIERSLYKNKCSYRNT